MVGVDLPDLGGRGGLIGLACGAGLCGGLAPVAAGARDAQDPAYPLHIEHGAVLGNEVPAVGAHFTARARQAAARRKISRSSRHSFSAFSSRLVLGPGTGQLLGPTGHGAPPAVGARTDWRPCRPTCAASPVHSPADARYSATASFRNSSGYEDLRPTWASLPGPSRSISRVSTPEGQPHSSPPLPGPRPPSRPHPDSSLTDPSHRHPVHKRRMLPPAVPNIGLPISIPAPTSVAPSD